MKWLANLVVAVAALGILDTAPAPIARQPAASAQRATVPAPQEPTEPAMLLCGLAVVAFMAWRKTRWMSDA